MTPRQFYLLKLRSDAPAVQLWGVAVDEPAGARGGYYLAGQSYSGPDRAAVANWLYEREAGYPLNLPLYRRLQTL
jgi:hypothetical protein